MWFLCMKRGKILAPCDTIGDSRDTRKGGEHGKEGGEPRISQCPLEEREDGDWKIDNEYLEAN